MDFCLKGKVETFFAQRVTGLGSFGWARDPHPAEHCMAGIFSFVFSSQLLLHHEEIFFIPHYQLIINI